ncbi:class I SAM-dependent methyltransferase [Altererythrobacter sp. GH1-8]|uniref:class I SAM-dependent methyltransferase n=1 Tax=Altererythrobacter sp. GH1-8 TaxID=3349333 RepID=UPI00374D89E7
MQAEGIKRGQELIHNGERFVPQPGWIARTVSPGFRTILDRLDHGFERGRLTGHLPDGTTRILGGRASGFEAEVYLKDWRALLRLVTGGSIGWYQAFEAGEWDSPDLVQVFALFSSNARALGTLGRAKGPFRMVAKIAHAFNRNSRAGAQRNISAHYDLGNDFYQAWLDPSMTYSSALFAKRGRLEDAQEAKWQGLSDRIAGAQSVLEIGCGWGGLAGHLAKEEGREVTAISLSDQQLAYARAHQQTAIDFRKQDYRDVRGQFDAIVSVEMVEALGREYWQTFMDALARNLKLGGRAAIQYISIADDLFEAYAKSADFIQAYIFPGGLLIRTSEFRKLAEERGLGWRDQYDFGLDYAETLKQWRTRFEQAADQGALPKGFDARFVALWRYYLAYCEGGFRAGTLDVHQVTLAKGE